MDRSCGDENGEGDHGNNGEFGEHFGGSRSELLVKDWLGVQERVGCKTSNGGDAAAERRRIHTTMLRQREVMYVTCSLSN